MIQLLLGDKMQTIMINLMDSFGYIGVFLLILIENLFPPIPSEVILSFGGFMTTSTSLTVLGVIFWATLGSVIGAIILYYIGKIFNKERLKKFTHTKVGKFVRLKEKDIELADRWFDTKGAKTVLICRCIPIVRSLISIPAGMSEMPMPKFLAYTTIGSAVWNTLIVSLGAAAGENWEKIVEILDRYSHLTLILLVILFIAAVVYFFAVYRKKK